MLGGLRFRGVLHIVDGDDCGARKWMRWWYHRGELSIRGLVVDWVQQFLVRPGFGRGFELGRKGRTGVKQRRLIEGTGVSEVIAAS